MSIDPDTIEVGERLYSERRYRMGNTVMSHTVIYVSIVKEVFHRDDGSVEWHHRFKKRTAGSIPSRIHDHSQKLITTSESDAQRR